MDRRLIAALLLIPFVAASPAQAEPTEEDYYRLTEIPIPDAIVLEVGGLEMMPDGRLAVSTRRGDIFMVSGATSDHVTRDVSFTRFAGGLHEVLGLAEREGQLYATQRGEVTRLTDEDGDGRADLLETVSDKWGINGDYHEYAFASRFDPHGELWVVLCLTGSASAADNSPFRGWCLRVAPDGTTRPTCSGIRSPGGVGLNAAGDAFYTDNQGPWNGTCGLKHLRPGSFQGNPAGNKYYSITEAIGPRPATPESGSRIMAQAKRLPQLEPTAVLFPYKKMGQSASGIVCDTTQGRFGPFANQMFVGDQTQSTVMRVYLEKVQDHYQGACFPFKNGFGSGSLALRLTDRGQLFVGGTNRGWGSVGRKPFALERLDWTGIVPFEIQEMHARPNGFRLLFTDPVDPSSASDKDSYRMTTYTYIYQSNYGSPEVDHTTPEIVSVTVSDDRKTVDLVVNGLQEGHVHELQVDGVRSTEGHPVLHPVAYYTLNYLPLE